MVAEAPGVRRQYANDFIISDWVLARGYAFASTDKGNTGAFFFRDGTRPGDAVAEWHRRTTQLTIAATRAAALRYGRAPRRTYMTGISNGGYLTRYAIERHPRLYDGAVDWEGTLFRAGGPNLLTFLPVALRNYARYKAGDQAARRAILAAGFPRGSQFLWHDHYAIYWDLTQRIYREEFDPRYDHYPDRLRPILPCYRRAVRQLEAWVERRSAPPRTGTIRRGGMWSTDARESRLARRAPIGRPLTDGGSRDGAGELVARGRSDVGRAWVGPWPGAPSKERAEARPPASSSRGCRSP